MQRDWYPIYIGTCNCACHPDPGARVLVGTVGTLRQSYRARRIAILPYTDRSIDLDHKDKEDVILAHLF